MAILCHNSGQRELKFAGQRVWGEKIENGELRMANSFNIPHSKFRIPFRFCTDHKSLTN